VEGPNVIQRVLAGLFALTWIVLPGFGMIDLTVTWSSTWPQVLEAGWGMFITFLVGVPFLAIAVRPRFPSGVLETLLVSTFALMVSGVVALERGCFILGLIVAVELAVVSWRWDARFAHLGDAKGWDRLSSVFAVLSLASAVPWIVYALHMWSLNRQDQPDSDVTMGVDHYSVQGALGIAVLGVALMLVPAGEPAGRRLMGFCAGISAAYVGLVSLAWHPTQGSFGPVWSILCMAWGLALVVLPWLPIARSANSGKDQLDDRVST